MLQPLLITVGPLHSRTTNTVLLSMQPPFFGISLLYGWSVHAVELSVNTQCLVPLTPS